MSLAIDALSGGSVDDENESPGGGKRKSELISPSSRAENRDNDWRRGRNPLSDVNAKGRAGGSSAAGAATPSKPRRTTPPLAPHSANRFKTPSSKSKSKEGLQATDEKQASVGQLSEWLSESAKKNRRKAIAGRPPTPGSKSGVASTTPVRLAIKPRIKKSEVQATDTKIASVKTLSSWMDGDPFEKRRVKTIRTGHRVIAKSRVFERDHPSTLTVRKECDIRVGSVEKKSAWLSEAFRSGEEEAPQPLLEKKVRPYQMKPKEEDKPEEELKSVRDKKDWLSKAFKKGEQQGSPAIGSARSFDCAAPTICRTGSFEVKTARASSAVPGISQAKSFDARATRATSIHAVPDIAKCASTDDGVARSSSMIQPRPSLERQRSVVRLYGQNDASDEESEEERSCGVHDRQAWLSNAFKKQPNRGSSPSSSALAGGEGDNARLSNAFEKRPNRGSSPSSAASVPADANTSNGKEGAGKSAPVVAAPAPTKAKENKKSVEGERPPDERAAIEAANAVDADGDYDDIISKMSVAERARWLRGAFKK